MQPRLLDKDHYYVALGSGKLSADPFLRFLTDIFCEKQPTVAEGIFLATWAVQHVIDVNPGGVAGPIRIGKYENTQNGTSAALLTGAEIDEHLQAVMSARSTLKEWRDSLAGLGENEAIPAQPEAPVI